MAGLLPHISGIETYVGEASIGVMSPRADWIDSAHSRPCKRTPQFLRKHSIWKPKMCRKRACDLNPKKYNWNSVEFLGVHASFSLMELQKRHTPATTVFLHAHTCAMCVLASSEQRYTSSTHWAFQPHVDSLSGGLTLVWLPAVDRRHGGPRNAIKRTAQTPQYTFYSMHRLFHFIFIFGWRAQSAATRDERIFSLSLSCELNWSRTKHDAIHLWRSSSLATRGVWKFNFTHTLGLTVCVCRERMYSSARIRLSILRESM